MNILIANPIGFCAGVDRAINIANEVIKRYATPIYIKHELVHNIHVIEDFKKKGAIFIENISDIPDNSIVIFSAHGVSIKVKEEARAKKLKIFDATCPLVSKIHFEVIASSKKDYQCILIGHQGHPEVEGILGYREYKRIHLIESKKDIEKLDIATKNLFYVTQTTLSFDDTEEIIVALKKKYPFIVGPKKDDICYATQNRQQALKDLAQEADIIFVLGSKYSSNTTRLVELGKKYHKDTYLISDYKAINKMWLKNKKTIGIAAGASAPSFLISELTAYLQENFVINKTKILQGINEKVKFPILPELRKKIF